MRDTNITTITNFVMIGFPGLERKYYGPVSALLFFTYLFILVGNLFVITIVGFERRFQKPTYLIHWNLAMTDLLFGTVTLPRIISRYWWDNKIVSFSACFVQMYFVHSLGAIHSLILLIMALDRFTAICLPLRYPVFITNKRISIACGLSWIGTFLRMMIVVFHALTLPYCDSNIIVQCYCDHSSITKLGCGDGVKFVKDVALGFAMFSLLLPVIFILFSYISIFLVVLRMRNIDGRSKALSTCTPQIFITCLYYLPRCFIYIAGNAGYTFSLNIRIIIILFYSLFPAIVNPIIYCFKMKDIKDFLRGKLKRVQVGITAASK
ncbi:olfactory receptor 52K1-like [Genypterus blacodes]|uniref:olfactory receptor 52K1-like n=1 Tax=Genypterus blacodes TaxID=154954 RepID=UPI003F76CFF0